MGEIILKTERNLEVQKIDGMKEAIIGGPLKDGFDPEFEDMVLSVNADNYFIQFDNTKVHWRAENGYPNPTLSHFALARHLTDQKLKARKLIDIGCGVGLLGNYMAKNSDIKDITFLDLNPNAVDQSVAAYQLNHNVNLSQSPVANGQFGPIVKTPKHNLELIVGPAPQALNGFDGEGCVAVAVPYFLPGICEVFPQAYGLFAQTAKNTGADIYIGHSNLASEQVETAARDNGLHLSATEEKEVPFMIEYHDECKSILDNLTDKGLVMKKGVPYHKLMVSKLSHKSNVSYMPSLKTVIPMGASIISGVLLNVINSGIISEITSGKYSVAEVSPVYASSK